MVRASILRFPLIRALVPRVSRPLLPLTGRLTGRSPEPSLARSASQSGTRLFHTFPSRLTSSPPPSPTSSDGGGPASLPPDATLSQRLKHLIKSYGWYALGVYIILSVLDFGVAFGAVNVLGAEHVSRVATLAKEFFVGLVYSKPLEPGREEMDRPHAQVNGHEGLFAVIAVAYTVHKTLFLPVRVGLTAALTPRLVGWLRQRGWAGGAGAQRAAREMREKIRNRRERD